MPRAIFLGTASAIPDEKHENTHFAVVGERQILLVDTPGSPIVRLRSAGIDPIQVTKIILTHFHPDHTHALPLLLMDMWLLGRTIDLDLYGLAETLERAEKVLDAYGWKKWPGFFKVNFNPLLTTSNMQVYEDDELIVMATPVCHLIPTIGLRLESKSTGKILAYSCDTEPCQAVIELACNADFLLHEVAGASKGHTSAEQAGAIASQSKARNLYLIHYPVGEKYQPEAWLKAAQEHFAGPVKLAQDLMELSF